MTQDQQVASAHWSMFAVDGFPVRKVGASKWIICVDSTSLWAVIGTSFPIVFRTKRSLKISSTTFACNALPNGVTRHEMSSLWS